MAEQGAAAALATLSPEEVPPGVPFPVYPLRIRGCGAGVVKELLGLATSLNARGIVFDHNDVDPEFLHSLHAASDGELLFAAIGNDLPVSEALGLAIRQRIFRPQEAHEKELVGPEYLLMRKAFRDRPRRAVRPVVRRLLVTLGGSDSAFLRTVLSALDRPLGGEPLEIYVAGRNLELGALTGHAHKVAFLGLVADMVSLLESVDLAITACGTTLYQMAACGLPAIGTALVADQLEQAADFAAAGLIEYLGPAESLDGEALFSATKSLIHDPERRRRMAALGQQFVDGRGAIRCAEALISLAARGNAG